jgi:hypothetical protein
MSRRCCHSRLLPLKQLVHAAAGAALNEAGLQSVPLPLPLHAACHDGALQLVTVTASHASKSAEPAAEPGRLPATALLHCVAAQQLLRCVAAQRSHSVALYDVTAAYCHAVPYYGHMM